MIEPITSESQEGVKLYSERWWILASVSVLQFANYGHWIAYGTVTKTTAIYYDQPGDKMDLVVLCSYAVSVPMCIVAMIVVRHCGLRNTLNWSGGLTALGSTMCCLSSFPHLDQLMDNETQFYLALLGQIVTGVGGP